MINNSEIDEILKIYTLIKKDIITRLEDFKQKYKDGTEEDIFAELVFCILTPQSKATTCWKAVCNLINNDLLLSSDVQKIAEIINPVRFKNNKAKYITLAKKVFLKNGKLDLKSVFDSFIDNYKLREWLVKNITGYGYKEAGHFLRNIGKGDNQAILDRHILKNLKLIGVLNEISKTISPKKYFEIEDKMKVFAQDIDIDITHLDIIFWYKETGEIFK